MKKIKIIILLISQILLVNCAKDFLNEKSISKQVIPYSIKDYQALLDRRSIMNEIGSVSQQMIAGEEFSISDEAFHALPDVTQKDTYIWKHDIFGDMASLDWNQGFQRIMYANLALDVNKITPNEEERAEWENVKGAALFHRAWNYFHLLLTFGKQFKKEMAGEQCPIPFRADYDVTDKGAILSYGDFYDRILKDVLESAELLPLSQPAKTRPNKAAAYLLLAKVYLQLNDFKSALKYADQAVRLNPVLLDYNNLSDIPRFPFADDSGISNPEVLFFQKGGEISILGNSRINVDMALYELYESTDLRKRFFFQAAQNNRLTFRGSYHGGVSSYFVGLAVDEAYLIRAECLVRLGRNKESLNDLNFLLEHRFEKGKFSTVQESNETSLLELILLERRKELCFRATRWETLRRLNAEGKLPTTLKRSLDSEEITNDWSKGTWFWKIPDFK
ncbi:MULTISPECIES: RagB/SusD family nutrient uptake outer membrane protein [Sphingobacterium]|uniref:RagB/SusD family nutrient uptake outer membrane protein n=1 Tax=Sphingobacterium TaxID=28453 RepID=UPI0013E521E9|nr:RagB/SusD family nutrient uptake outer membrane protein [Sphingobacterium sp. DR205]QIH31492.1 RagB/SusD family nutrient uptake outer membrane protein [Sphingobacterium sp. DR205]